MKTAVLFVLFTSIIFAQSNGVLSSHGGKAYISIKAGPSFPLDNFGDDNPNNPNSGFAKTGYSIELSGGIRFFNLLEISIVGFRNVNGTDLDKLITKFNQSYPGVGFSGSSDEWITYGALGGFGLSYPAGYNFFGDINILGGYLSATSPVILLNTSSADTYAKIESTTGTNFVTYFSGAVRRPLSERIHLSLGIGYLWGTAKFKDVKTLTSIDGNITESTTSFDRGMNTWEINLGLRYILF